jgi:hypothetical protein
MYTVTAMLVIATDENGVRHHLYQGAPLPASIGQDELDRLASEGFIADAAEVEAEAAAPAVDEAPKGNASREDWAAYAKSKGAPDEETADGGLTQTELRAKYGK